MTHTLSISQVGGSASDVSVKQFDQTHLVEKGAPTVDSSSGLITRTWIVDNADTLYPCTVTATIRDDVRAGRRAVNVYFNRWMTDDDGVVAPVVKPFSTVIGFTMPFGVGYEAQDILDAIASHFSLMYHTLTSKVMDTGVISALALGSMDLY